MVIECCLESRMRSRMSRGVSEWSGGKDLYMESCFKSSGKSFSFSVLCREASGNFHGSPEVHQGFHHIPRVSMVLGEVPWPYWARSTYVPQRPMLYGKVESPLLYGREGGGLGFHLLPPWLCPRVWRGCSPRPI